MYKALVDRDVAFEGQFVAAIKSTGIFCRSSCTARKPKFENVEFYKTAKEAIQYGFRPCKICRPLQGLNEVPPHIVELIEAIQQDPTCRINDMALRRRGIEPNALRRWFLKNHNMTFHAFQRMYRINTAFKNIKQGEAITHAAYNAGYESLSGFTDSFKNIFGSSPRQIKSNKLIDLCRFDTPLGPMFACADEKGICLLEFTDRRMLESEFKDLSKRLNATIVQHDNVHFKILKQQLKLYFERKLRTFNVPLSMQGTPFQMEVWNELMNIPYGSTRSYLQQAIALGKPSAIRAVANSNGMNKIAIIIPCHRVIGSDGQLTGYGGGLWRKKFLLELEQENKQQEFLF